MMTIVDYGLGNVMAFANVYKRLNVSVTIATSAFDLKNASKIILPGVGAFDQAIERIDQSGMREALNTKVLCDRVPVLGVCVGMQVMAHSSEEGHKSGLGWIEGQVKKFGPSTLPHRTRLPHMGWNDVQPTTKNRLFEGLERDARFYFLHSYYFHCIRSEDILAVSDYGGTFCCAVGSENIYGIQFHPEKSHHFGTQLLKNFLDL